MAENPTDRTTPDVAPAKKKRGLFRFLFKSTLGCVAFAAGSLVALILLLPTLLSTPGRGAIEGIFEKQFHGRLTVRELHLAWFGAQRIEDAALFDPDGVEVARVSMTAPSLVQLISSEGVRLGRITANVTANLVADDRGVTNLERALEQREPHPGADDDDEDEDARDWKAKLGELDAEIVLTIPRLTWSDPDTRRAGVPFEVRDFQGTFTARPGKGLRVAALGKQFSDAPGDLKVDVSVASIVPGQAWPFGAIDAHVQIAALSTALLDALAGRSGELRETLGPRFDLRADVTRATLQSGEVHAELASERCELKVAGTFADGVLVCGVEPLVTCRIAEPRRLLERTLASLAPPNTRWAWDATPATWTFAVSDARIPLPAADAGAAAWRAAVASAVAKIEIALPSGLAIERESARGEHASAGAKDVHVSVVASGPTAPWKANVACALTGATETGKLALEVRLSDTAQAVATGVLPRCDLDLHLDGVPLASMDALFLEKPMLAEVLGRALAIDVQARDVTPQGGTIVLDAKADALSLHLDGIVQDGALHGRGVRALTLRIARLPEALVASLLPGASGSIAIEIAKEPIDVAASELTLPLPWIFGSTAPMPELEKGFAVNVVASLPSGSIAMRTPDATAQRVAWRTAQFSVRVQPGGGTTVELDSTLDAGGASRLSLIAKSANAWSWMNVADPSQAPPVDAELALTDVSTSFVDAWLAQNGRLASALGAKLDVHASAEKLRLDSGRATVRVESPTLAVEFAGNVEAGVLAAHGDDGLKLKWKPTLAAVSREAGALLPSGAELVWPSQGGEVSLTVRELRWPLPISASAATSAASKAGGSNAKAPSSTTLAWLDELACTVELSCAELGYRNEALRAAKLEPRCKNATLRASIAPKTAAAIDLAATLELGAPATIEGHAKLDGLAALASGAGGAWSVEGSLDARGIAMRALDALFATKPTFEPWLGASADLHAEASHATTQGADLRATLHSPACELAFDGVLRDGAVVCSAKQGLDVSLVPSSAAFAALVRDSFPQGTTIRLVDAKAPVHLVVKDLALPMPKPAVETAEAKVANDAHAATASATAPSLDARAGDGQPAMAASGTKKLDPHAIAKNPDATHGSGTQASSEKPADLAWLAKLSAHLELTVPSFEYSDATTVKAGKPAVVRGMSCALDASPNKPPSLALKATIEDETPGELDARVNALEPLDVLAGPNGLGDLHAAIDVKCKSLPTAWIDAAAKQDGLLVGTLGPRLDLALQSKSLSTNAGAFAVDLSSKDAKLHCEGALDAGAVHIDKVDGLSASFGLTPIASERVVGKLVPALVHLEKPQGAEPVLLAVDQLRFPLDGDLSKLDAIVRLNLGDVSYQLLPGLGELLSAAGPQKTTRIAPIKVPIEKGVARYDALPIRVGSHDIVLRGSFNLANQNLALATDVPLSLFGTRVNAELDRVREFLKPDAAIPIEIRGTWKNPSVRIGDDFLKKVVGDAAGKGLEGLLKDALGGKKKKDKN